MTKQQWKHLYRQVRLGRWEVMPTSEIEISGRMIITIYGLRAKSVKMVTLDVPEVLTD